MNALARGLAGLFVVVGIAVAWWAHGQHFQWSAESLRSWIAQWPFAPLVFIAVIVLCPFLVLPSALVMTAGGALFGVVEGTLLSTVGGTLSGLMVFWLARSLGRELAERRFGTRLRAADAYVSDRGASLVAVLTAFPATPLSVAQLAFGLSGISALRFSLATLAGMLPRTALLAWFGDSLAQAQWLRAGAAFALIIAAILFGLQMRRRLSTVRA